MSRILILGGTGAMGAHLVNILEKSDNEVFVTTRKQRAGHSNITYIQGNAHDEIFIRQILKDNVDVVVDFMVYKTEEFKRRALLMLDSCKQYVYLSSSRVYSDNDDIITEDTPRLLDVSRDEEYLSTDEYALSKARQEDLLRQSGRSNWTIIRPYITYSEIRLQLGVNEKETWLYRALHGHTIVFSEDIARNYTTLTYGYDVARGIASVIGNHRALGEAFHITQSQPLKWKEVLDLYLSVIEEKTGHRPKVLMRTKSPNLAFGKWQVMYDRWYNRKFDSAKIGNFIQTDSFLPPEVGLRKCLMAFIDNPQFNDIDWVLEAQYDRWTGECYLPFRKNQTWKQCIRYYLNRFIINTSKRYS